MIIPGYPLVGRWYRAVMCRYATTVYKVHYVCLPCCRSHKHSWDSAEHLCTSCRRPMVFAGHDFATPRRRDDSGWAAVEAVLIAGLRYEGFSTCGCSREPGFRPRTKAQVRARLRVARRNGVAQVEALAARDPHDIG